jgi:rSAM/selenodomain-associated transferase 1
MPQNSGGLALFLHHPAPGTVKSKLVQALGPERAARFYWECALLALAKALRLKHVDVFVFVTPPGKEAEVEGMVMARFGGFEGRFIPQRGNTLGERINHALERLRMLGYERQFVLGTDSPTIPQEYLQRAVDELANHDCVLGPTWDGGYYLVGMKQPDVRIFRDVVFGSGQQLGQTFDNMAALGRRCLLLPRWQDVDAEDDLPFLEGQFRHADYKRLKSMLEGGET